MKKKIIVILFLIITVFILLVLFSIKFYKVNKIIKLMKLNVRRDNYSYFVKNSLDDMSKVFVRYNKGVVLRKVALNTNIYDYYDFNNGFVYNLDIENNLHTKRSLQEYDKKFLEFPLYQFLTSDYSFKNKLKLVFEWKIKDYGENCYEITTKNNYKIIFDKTTGIALRAMNYDLDEKFDRVVEDFKENSVTDEETKLPDLSEYSLWEGN